MLLLLRDPVRHPAPEPGPARGLLPARAAGLGAADAGGPGGPVLRPGEWTRTRWDPVGTPSGPRRDPVGTPLGPR